MSASPSARSIGFIGLGKMGVPMARQLASHGFRVLGCDASEELAKAALAGVPDASVANPTQIGQACDIVILMLPDSNVVRNVLFGADGGLSALMKKGSIVIDMSSSDPSVTRELGAQLTQIGIRLVDAPVSGGVKRAVTGTLSIMAGGTSADVEQVRPVLAAMGSTITETGPLGSAHAMKALNNYVSAAGLVASCEALKIGQAFGLEPEKIVSILNSSTGKNNSTEHKLSQFIVSGKFDSGFSLGLMKKDLSIAIGLADKLHTKTAIGTCVLDAWDGAEKQLGKSADHTEIYKILEGD